MLPRKAEAGAVASYVWRIAGAEMTGDWVDRFEESIGIWLKPKLTRDELAKLSNFIHYEIMSAKKKHPPETPQYEIEAAENFR